jgi:hypothetical protein
MLVAVVILGGVVVVAMGRGGELARDRVALPSRADLRTWADVAAYRPPAALLGYHAVVTERALSIIARTIAEKDAEIDWLRNRLGELQPEAGPDTGSPDTGSPDARAAATAGGRGVAEASDPVVADGGPAAADPAAEAGGLTSATEWQGQPAAAAEPPVEAGFTAQPTLGSRARPDE